MITKGNLLRLVVSLTAFASLASLGGGFELSPIITKGLTKFSYQVNVLFLILILIISTLLLIRITR